MGFEEPTVILKKGAEADVAASKLIPVHIHLMNKVFEPSLPKLSPQLPVELWLQILSNLSLKDLKTFRLTSSKWMPYSNFLINKTLTPRFSALESERIDLNEILASVTLHKLPELTHYKSFLTDPNIVESMEEAQWIVVAPVEVQTICECLVRLYGAIEEDDSTRISWLNIRCIMRLDDFKTWLVSLSDNVDHVPYQYAQDVEQIIRTDPAITYERLRIVSNAGYRLLIAVAAILQYSSISEEILRRTREVAELDVSIEKSVTFLNCLI